MIVEEKSFSVQDTFHKTGVLSAQVNIDRLPRLAFNLRKESESGKDRANSRGAEDEAGRHRAQRRAVRAVHRFR